MQGVNWTGLVGITSILIIVSLVLGLVKKYYDPQADTEILEIISGAVMAIALVMLLVSYLVLRNRVQMTAIIPVVATTCVLMAICVVFDFLVIAQKYYGFDMLPQTSCTLEGISTTLKIVLIVVVFGLFGGCFA